MTIFRLTVAGVPSLLPTQQKHSGTVKLHSKFRAKSYHFVVFSRYCCNSLHLTGSQTQKRRQIRQKNAVFGYANWQKVIQRLCLVYQLYHVGTLFV